MEINIPDDILYLVHTTCKKYKDESGNLIWTEIKTNGTDQYPGAYFSLITKDNRLTERLFPSTECLIFSRKLLKQQNYHVNMRDNNGYITEENTLFPQHLQEIVENIKVNSKIPLDKECVNTHRMNEVVFHNAVPMDYLCFDLPCKFFSNDFLPELPMENNTEPDMSLLPDYSFYPISDK